VKRRGFLQTVAAAGALPQVRARGQNAAKAPIEYPRKFTGRQLAMIAFPLGGVGAGSISLGGRGQLRDWEIFNRPDKGRSPAYAFAAIRAGDVARVLESRILPPYEGPSGLGSANVPGLPRLAGATFTGEFPLARIDFDDPDLPVRVALEAFTPFIPNDADESGLPVAVLRYRVVNRAARVVKVGIALSIDNPVGTQGRANEFRTGAGVEGLFMRNPFLAASDPFAGSFALGVLGRGDGKLTYLRGWRGGSRWRVGPQAFWDDFSADGELGPEASVRDTVGSLCLTREIPARQEAEFTFLLAWHFPNRTPQGCGWSPVKGEERAAIGNHYAKRFGDAWKAAEYAAERLPELEKRTRRFAAVMRESTLPAAVKEAAMANLSTLVTPTCFRTADGHFHGFEGSNNQAGCCFGNCTHVWNYEPATQHVFPALARSLRESAFGFCTDDEGRQDFRQLLPPNQQRWGNAAADGQMGQIMKLYLDWKLSGDTAWLRRHWPAAKRALEFAWIAGGWDADRDGVMEGVQHNTYDVEFYGPNPLCGVWYLGALRAAEEMARAVSDTASANEYARLFRNGSKWIDENLFNGEYYVQKIQGVAKEKVAKGLIVGMGAADTEHPDFQLGDGCLVDQLAGQYMADLAGLGNLLQEAHIRRALESIYKYNYKRSMARHESVQRVYALNDEAALVVCDYGRGQRPEIPFPYFAELFTGLEYVAATLMLSHGMAAQGIECIENIRRRYDGERRNPWNEAECGHHYARAMASWAPVAALGGFRYHAAERSLAVLPVGKGVARSFWSTGTGWGEFQANTAARELRVGVEEGELRVLSVQVAWKTAAMAATIGQRKVACKAGGELGEEITLRAGDELRLRG
jgi:non-lysosomal glucosylceramidase